MGRGRITDRQGAFRFILDEPFGRLSLLIIALGLIGYAMWRFSSGIADSERHGSDLRGFVIRAGSVIGGVAYGWVAVALALQVIHHAGPGKSSDTQARHWTSRVMDEPFGRWLVAIAGACIIGYCGWQLAAPRAEVRQVGAVSASSGVGDAGLHELGHPCRNPWAAVRRHLRVEDADGRGKGALASFAACFEL